VARAEIGASDDEVTDGGGGKGVCPSAAGGRRGHLRAAQNQRRYVVVPFRFGDVLGASQWRAAAKQARER